MCATVLQLEGYTSVEPQAPRGGSDGGKDIKFGDPHGFGIAACYFPHSPSTPSALAAKFRKDANAARVNGAARFVFFTGQRLTLRERQQLADSSMPIDIFDLDRLIPRASEILPFIGESEPIGYDSAVATKRSTDVVTLNRLMFCCDFFDLSTATSQSPYRFEETLLNTERLNHLFDTNRIHFYDPMLSRLVDEWWTAWEAIVNLMRPHFDWSGSGAIFLSAAKQAELGKDAQYLATYLAELEAGATSFRRAHHQLLGYSRQHYPDAVPV